MTWTPTRTQAAARSNYTEQHIGALEASRVPTRAGGAFGDWTLMMEMKGGAAAPPASAASQPEVA